MAGLVGGQFDEVAQQQREVTERLQAGPGQEAAQVGAVGKLDPAPGKWTLATIRAHVAGLDSYTLSGVWRVLQRLGVSLRSAVVQLFSPDPEYALKKQRLERVLRAAARQPGQVEALFLDEFGFYRWPDSARDWGITSTRATRA